MMEKQQINHDLAAKVLSGNASQAELEHWKHHVAAGGVNEELESLQKIWKYSDTDVDVNVDDAWRKVNAATTKNSDENKFSFMPASIMKAAAAVLILLSAGSVYWYLSKDQLEVLRSSENTVGITLSDGTIVTLGPSSTLQYPVEFAGDLRSVELTGQGYFDVAKDKAHAFVIATEAGSIQVLGTAFEINTTDPDNPLVVEVEEGLVEVTNALHYEKAQVKAGETAIINRNESLVVSEIEHPAPFFWKDKTIKFKRAALVDVVSSLDELLGMKIVLKDDTMQHCELTVTFKDENPATIIEIIAATLNLTYSVEGGAFLLSGNGC